MESKSESIKVDELREMLENKEPVVVLDVRPKDQRAEWKIPGSIYADAYKRLNENDPTVLDDVEIPANSKVITVCTAGRTSQLAANKLRKKGIDAYSLENGMKGWSLAWNTAAISFDKYQIIQLRRTGKGCLSYIVVADGQAVIVDASLPVDVYKNILAHGNWNIVAVIETHIHADHLSRSKQLADQLKTSLLLPVPNNVTFPYKKIQDGQIIRLGDIFIKVIATPGHTTESVCFLVNDEVLLSGDTIFTNAVGRPDLKAGEEETKNRAALLYGSLQKINHLNDNIIVLPAHTGSPIDFDSKPVQATIAEIKKNIPILQLSQDEFIATILAKLPPAPANYAAIIEKNLSGDFSDINPVDLEAGANRCAIS